MEQSTAQRRLVKSPPELWAEVSSEDTLRRHLSEFGEIRITRVDPETTVAWEGDRASGTVELAPAGWGTKVVLTAAVAPEPGPQPRPAVAAPAAAAASPPERRGFLARLFRRQAPPPPPPPAPAAPAPAPVAAVSARVDPERTVAILSEVLDDLGAAHHRPFSRD